MEKRVNEKYQEYFQGPVVVVKEVEIIETYKDYTALVNMDGVEKHVRWSPFGGEFVMKPASTLQKEFAMKVTKENTTVQFREHGEIKLPAGLRVSEIPGGTNGVILSPDQVMDKVPEKTVEKLVNVPTPDPSKTREHRIEMDPSLQLPRHNVGDKVVLTAQNIRTMENSNRSIKVYPSDSFLKSIKEVFAENPNGVVTHTFSPGYETTVDFNGRAFHMQHNWITNPVHEKAKTAKPKSKGMSM